MAKKYFGTDGIRGRVNEKLTPDFVIRVGQALGIVFKNGGERRHTVVIGKDPRLSGYMIEPALVAGFVSVGMDVKIYGPMPTNAVGMMTSGVRADVGVMISASHNPYEDNGIKIFLPDGNKLPDEMEDQIEALIDADPSPYLVPPGQGGRTERIEDAKSRYIQYVKDSISSNLNLEGMRVVLDGGNGAAYKVGPSILKELGAELFTIGCDPDGFNINAGVGAYHPGQMCAEVRRLRADVGIAFDGDADRVVFADENGRLIDGDHLLGVLAARFGVMEGVVVGTVMTNSGLERYLNSFEVRLERTDVGDQNVLARMKEVGARLGGEPSGHILLTDYARTSDGPLTALHVLRILREEGKPASKVLWPFEPLPQALVGFKTNHAKELLASRNLQDQLASEEARIAELGGRLVVRASGTEPKIRVMAEAETRNVAEEAVQRVMTILRSVEREW